MNNTTVPAYIRLKLSSICSECSKKIEKGELAFWIAAERKTIHRNCGKEEWKVLGSNYAMRKEFAIKLHKIDSKGLIKDVLAVMREQYTVPYWRLRKKFEQVDIIPCLNFLVSRKLISFTIEDKEVFILPPDPSHVVFNITPKGNHFNIDADKIEVSWL